MKNIIVLDNGMKVRRVSRWITIQGKAVTPRHRLYDYADHYADDSLTYFRHGGREYALGQFMRLDTPLVYTDAEHHPIVAHDATEWYRPYLMEFDNVGERVRLYEEI